jgi:hypothetical protein
MAKTKIVKADLLCGECLTDALVSYTIEADGGPAVAQCPECGLEGWDDTIADLVRSGEF